jgi:hypothetical protein
VRRLRPELWRQNNWLFHHNNVQSNTFFLTWEFFTKNNMTVVHDYFSLFPRLKTKLKGRHFNTIEVIEAESHAALNTLTEQEL